MNDHSPWPDGYALRGTKLDTEILVIGAGIIGVCTALELQAAGHDVTLVDRKGVAEECSFGNAGHIAVEHIFPLSNANTLLSVPKMLMQKNGPLSILPSYLPQLMPWLVRFLWAGRPAQVAHGTKAIAALNAQAIAAYRSLDARFGLDGLLREEGTLVVCESEKGAETLLSEADTLANFDIETDWLEPKDLRACDPALSPALEGGLRFPGSAHISDPARLTRKLAAHFMRLGGQIEKRAVTSLENAPGHQTVHTNFGKLCAEKLVIAAGAWSHTLLAHLGVNVPLETERGYHLMLENPSHQPAVPTTFLERRFVATPMEKGLRLAGRVELGGLTLPAREAQAHALMPLGQDLLPGLKAKSATPWMGFRPTLPDSLPVISDLPGHPGIYAVFGHNHMGLTHGALTGQLMRDLMSGETPCLDLSPYRINRF